MGFFLYLHRKHVGLPLNQIALKCLTSPKSGEVIISFYDPGNSANTWSNCSTIVTIPPMICGNKQRAADTNDLSTQNLIERTHLASQHPSNLWRCALAGWLRVTFHKSLAELLDSLRAVAATPVALH